MPIDWFPLWLSLRVAGFATVISLAISLCVAYLLARREWRGEEVLDAATTLPLVLPPAVLGYYLLILAGRQSAFARSLGDFGITIMIAGNIPGRTQTVAVAIYDAVESGNGALARALVLVISAVAIAILYFTNRLERRQPAG